MKKSFSINYRRYTAFIIKYRILIILLTSVVTLFAALFLPGLQVKNDTKKFLPGKDDPVIQSQKIFDSLFTSSDYIYLLVESDSVQKDSLLISIDSISSRIKRIEGINGVYSIIDAEKIEWTNVFNILIPTAVPVFKKIDEESDLSSDFTMIKNSGIYTDNVVSKDFRKFNVIISLKNMGGGEEYETRMDSLIDKISRVLSFYPENQYKFYVAGAPLIDRELSNIVKKDLKIFIPLSIIISLIILFLSLRKFYPIFLVLLVTSVSLIWSLAVVSISGTSLSVGLSVIVPLILVISIAYSLHYIYHYQTISLKENHRITILNNTLQEVLLPSLFAGSTTAAGFFSLLLSNFTGVREIGLFIGIGILFSMYGTNVLLPALLSFKEILPRGKKDFLKSFLPVMRDFTITHYKFVIISFLIVFGFALYEFSNIKMNTNLLNYINQDYQIRKSFSKIDSVFGGTLPLEIIIPSSYAKSGESIAYIDSLAEKINTEKIVGNTLSIINILEFIDFSIPEHEETIQIPFSFKDRNYPRSFWKSVSKSDMGRNFVSLRDSLIYFRISCRVRSVGSDELDSLLKNIKPYLSNGVSNHVIVAGIVPFYVELNHIIISSQIKSFITAFLFILLIFLVFARSFKIGLISIIPNLFPIIVTIGLLGIIQVPLDLSNIMIASIAIGIIVDDTIHFLFNYRKEKNLTAVQKIGLVYNSISVPVFATSVIVAAGFFVLGFSDFLPTKYFGILSGVLVMVALLADLILFPALLILFDTSD